MGYLWRAVVVPKGRQSALPEHFEGSIAMSTNQIKPVSVIIPVYNDASRIRLALNALLNQTYPNDAYEIIVVDNKSNDGTPQVVEEFQQRLPKKVRLAFENETQSSYAARNRGIEVARGEILAFTDADCIPQPTWLNAGVRALDKELAGSGGGQIALTIHSDRPNIYEYFDLSTINLKQERYIRLASFSATANFFVRKRLFERHGLFLSELKSGGDVEFGKRISKAGEKMIYIPDAVVQHPARKTFKALYKKSKRVALGQRQLNNSNLVKYDNFYFFKNKCVNFSCPVNEEWLESLSSLEKAQVILLQSFLNWTKFLIRIS